MRTLTAIPLGAIAAVIFDGNKFPYPDACDGGFLPKAGYDAQITPLFRSASKFIAPRFNDLMRWDFNVTHSFKTQMQCQDFIGARRTVLPASLFELMILTRNNGVTYTRYYKQCLLTTNECVQDIGTSCRFRYSILSNTPYSITP